MIPAKQYPCHALERIVGLQQVLVKEDQESVFPNGAKLSPMQTVYHAAEFCKRLSRVIQATCAPLQNVLEQELRSNAAKMSELEQEEQELLLALSSKEIEVMQS